MISAPDRSEAAEYYFKYIDRVPPGDICVILEQQGQDTLALMRGISEAQSRQRYADGKWSIREVLAHINDTERLFVARAFWFAHRSRVSISTSQPAPPAPTIVRGQATSTSFATFARRRSLSSAIYPRKAGLATVLRATTRSAFARSPIWRPDT